MTSEDEGLIRAVSAGRVADRQVSELIGFARGLVADGTLNQLEVENFNAWLIANQAAMANPVIGFLSVRMRAIMADGVADSDERKDLFELLSRLTGGDIAEGETLRSTDLPLCRPAPFVEFDDHQFCVTGTFNYGQRAKVEAAIAERGGRLGGISGKTHFLVIGDYAADTWKYSAFGTKIMDGVKLRDKGSGLHIVSESHWRNFL